MKRAKKLYTMLGILALVCAAAFVALNYEEKQEKIKNSDEIILEIAADEVRALSWENDSTAVSFTKNETWAYDGDEAFPVDEEKINDLLEVFESFGVSFVIEEVEDFGQYGLDNPICEVKITTEDDSYEIAMGDFSAMDSQRYVSIGDGNVYLVNEDPSEYFDAGLSDVIKHDEIETFKVADSILFEGDTAYEIIYDEDSTVSYCEEDVYFVEENGEQQPLDTEKIEAYLDKISGLKLTDYATYNALEDGLEAYGLEEPELAVTVKWTEEEEKEFVLHVGRDKDENAYVRVNKSLIIYEITEVEYNYLMAMLYDDLCHREIFVADFADVNKVELILDGEEYVLTAKGKGDNRIFYYDDQSIDIDEFENALLELDIDEFTEEEASGKEEIRMTLYLNDDNHAELEIVLYQYDGSNCLAAVNGENVALVSRSLVVDLKEAVNEIVLD